MKKKIQLSYLVYFFLFLCLNGLYYQTQSDTVFPTYIFGFYSDGVNALPTSFGCFSFIGMVMNFVGKFINPILVYDGFQVFVVLFSVFVVSNFIISSTAFNFLKLFPLFFVPAILLSDFFSPFEFSKTSFILAFAALILHLKNKAKFIPSILFITAFLIRPEPLIIVLIISTLYQFCFFESTSYVAKIFNTIKVNTPLALAVLFVSFFINLNFTTEDKFYKEIRPYEYTLSDFKNSTKNSTSLSKNDSIKIHAAKQFFYADKEELNIKYFNNLNIPQRDKTFISILENFRNVNFVFHDDFIQKFWCVKPYIFFGFLLFIISILTFDVYLIFFLFSIHLLIIFISINFKAELHFITPTLSIGYILSIIRILNSKNLNQRLMYKGRYLGSLLIILSCFSILTFQKNIVSRSKLKHNYFSKVIDLIEGEKQNKLLLHISVWDELHYKLFTKIQPLNFHDVLVIDGGVLYINEAYNKKNQNVTNEKTFIEQYKTLINQKNIKVFSSKERLSMISNYVKNIHNYDNKFKEIRKINFDDDCSSSKIIHEVSIFEVLNE